MTTTLSDPRPAEVTISLREMIETPGVYVVEISPADAAEMLTRNEHNRAMKPRAVQEYTRAMKNGQWKLTNQGIGFDSDGQLSDGQNRLQACILADTPFTTLLITGLEPQSREVVDTGVKRLFADVLKMNQFSNVHWLSASTGLRFRYEFLVEEKRPYHHFNLPQMRGSHEELLKFLHDHPTIESELNQSVPLRRAFPSLTPAAVVVFSSLATEIDPDALHEFRNTLISGANLSQGDPRLILRNFLARTESGFKGQATSMFMLGILIKTWNDWRHGQTRQYIHLKDNEAMPAMDALRRRRKSEDPGQPGVAQQTHQRAQEEEDVR